MIYVLIIFALILIMPIEVVITKNDSRSDIDIFLTKIFNIRIDFDEFIKKIVSDKDSKDQKVTIKSVIHTYDLLKRERFSLKKIASMTAIRKLTFILKTKSNSLEADTWGFVGSWTIFGYTKNYMHRYFRSVENEYYNHQISPQFNVNLESELHMRFITFVYLLWKLRKISGS